MKTKSIIIGEDLRCDVARLLTSRLLVQANSGGGKSWCIRRLLEQTNGHAQQLVIDPEGEFATLREKFDYVLAARQGGDTVADPCSAKLLAERLLELGVSAILDIYELKAHERVRFVKNFLEALVDAPKSLWHPVIVVVDECHVYCPEKGHGEAESSGAVIDLCTRGRKRGFCAVLATQRISKLNKDAAAELNNKLIGRSSLDIDMKRAANELGFNSKDEMLRLRDLEDGQFFGFGPAISKIVTLVKVGDVQTTHPESGSRLAAVVPPPTDKVRAILSKLADLPVEAEAREKTVADFKQEISTLKRQLTEAKKLQPAPAAPAEPLPPEPPEKIHVVSESDMVEVSEAAKLFESMIATDRDRTSAARELATSLQNIHAALLHIKQPRPINKVRTPPAISISQRHNLKSFPVESNGHIPRAQQRILNGLAFLAGIGVTPANKTQLALIVGVSPTSGGYFNNLGALRTLGHIEYPGAGTVSLTQDGQAIASTDGIPSTTEELHSAIQSKIPAAKWKILEALIRAYPEAIGKDELADSIGVSPTSGGYFNNLGSLRSLGLIDYPQPGAAIARPVLFLEFLES